MLHTDPGQKDSFFKPMLLLLSSVANRFQLRYIIASRLLSLHGFGDFNNIEERYH